MNYKRILMYLIPSIIVIVLILTLLGIKLSFVINSELKVQTNTPSTILQATNGDTLSLEFETLVDAHGACSTMCSFILRDISSNETLFTDSREVHSSITYAIPYKVNNSFSAQSYIQYQVVCANQESTLCSTSKESFYETTFIVINHSQSILQEEKETSLESSLSDISSYISHTKKLLDESQFYLSQMSHSFMEKTELYSSLMSMNNELSITKNRFLSILDVWNDGDYESIDESSVSLLLAQSNQQHNEGTRLQNETIQIISKYESYMLTIQELSSYEEELLFLKEYFTQTQNNSQINKITALLDQLSIEVNSFNQGSISLYDLEFLKPQIISMVELKKEIEFDAISNTTRVTLPFYQGNVSTFDDACIALEKSLVAIQEHDATTNTTLNLYYSNLLANSTFISLLDTYALAIYNNQSFNDTSYPFSTIVAYHPNWTIDIQEVQNEYCFTTQNTSLNVSLSNFTLEIPQINITTTSIEWYEKTSCAYGRCSSFTKPSYPIILVHGHALNKRTSVQESLRSFALFQNKFESLNYFNPGELTDYTTTAWNNLAAPLTLRTSYYYLSYIDVGQFHLSTQKAQSIENYGIRLKEIVEEVKERTNQDKVIIIAHSMGGLVTRQYLSLFGEESVEKVILIGTPNNGVVGSTSKYCSVVGAKNECDEMTQGSVFLKRLNQYVPQIPVYVIAGVGCDMGEWEGDGVVTKESALLDYANNTIINGTCTDAFGSEMHSDLLNPAKYPEVFDLVQNILTS